MQAHRARAIPHDYPPSERDDAERHHSIDYRKAERADLREVAGVCAEAGLRDSDSGAQMINRLLLLQEIEAR